MTGPTLTIRSLVCVLLLRSSERFDRRHWISSCWDISFHFCRRIRKVFRIVSVESLWEICYLLDWCTSTWEINLDPKYKTALRLGDLSYIFRNPTCKNELASLSCCLNALIVEPIQGTTLTTSYVNLADLWISLNLVINHTLSFWPIYSCSDARKQANTIVPVGNDKKH